MKRPTWRVILGIVAIAATATSLLIFGRSSRIVSTSYASELRRGGRFADALEARLAITEGDSARTADITVALYLERLRLGLGSPFRLVDEALRDAMLPPPSRRSLAFALLDRTLEGRAYQSDPAALDRVVPQDSAPGEVAVAATGEQHLALIRDVVRQERDPRVGELAVRLAYRLASASGAVIPRAVELATNAASQERDRILAMRDARALVRAAEGLGRDPFAVMRAWRDDRRFAVERPVMNALAPRAERAAVERVPAVVRRIEQLAGLSPELWNASPSSTRPAVDSSARSVESTYPLGAGVARRMAAVARLRNAPPQGPIAVTVAAYSTLIQRDLVTTDARDAARRFVAEVRNEESLAAEYALLRSRVRGDVPEVAATVLTASVALRPYAQERVWLPDDQAPGTWDLEARYGITVTFDGTVETAWRGYLRRNLASALGDLRRVLPGFDPRGLHVHFGDSPLHERALALHDPVSRTIYFPAGSSAGVMAHEFAHDLDWQAARRYYGGSVGYRTDRAVRQSTDQLASAMRQLAGALRPEMNRAPSESQARPTEIFARNVDWFVSAALSREGRMNGYLSAAQDGMLTGYGSAMSPESRRDGGSVGGGSATLRALDGMTTIPAPLREWYADHFGSGHETTVQEAVRAVLEVSVARVDVRTSSAYGYSANESIRALFRGAPGTSDAWSCLLEGYSEQTVDPRAAREAMEYAAETRARGITRRWAAMARHYATQSQGALRVFQGAPWDPELAEQMTKQVRDAILWRALMDATALDRQASFLMPRGATALERCTALR